MRGRWLAAVPAKNRHYPRKRVIQVHTGDYWMPRWSLSSGGARADPLAGHDGFSCRAIVLRSSVMRLIVIPFALNPM